MENQSRTRNSFIHQTKNSNIVLFGEVLADAFPDKTVLGGAPFNVARHLKAFGQTPVLISRLGDDALGHEVMDVITQSGMETLGIQCSQKYPTGRVQVKIDGKTNHFEILPEQAYDYIHPAVVRMTTLSASPSLVYFGTLAQRQPVSARALKSMLRSTDAAKFLDINLRAPWYDEATIQYSLQYANIVKLNNEELDVLTKLLNLTSQEPASRVTELIQRFDLEQIIVTCGENGSWQIGKTGKKIEAKLKKPLANLVDTVGAGDGFAAVWILGLQKRWSIAKTLERSNTFATAICAIRGAIPGSAAFYEPFIREWSS